MGHDTAAPQSDADEFDVARGNGGPCRRAAGLSDWLGVIYQPLDRHWRPVLVFFMFFFTDAQRNGVGTGIVASLGYWLNSRKSSGATNPGTTSWCHSIYEFLPGIYRWQQAIGLISFRRVRARFGRVRTGCRAPIWMRSQHHPVAGQIRRQLFRARFCWLLIVTNIIAYSIAGEKCPGFTHPTASIILAHGWSVA
jgi:hypothetical protein